MADKYLINTGTGLKQVEATISSTGEAEGGKIVALNPTGRLDSSLMPPGYGDDAKAFPVAEDLAAGDFVNIFDDAGTIKVRKADASAANKRIAHGFVKEAALVGANVTVYFESVNDQLAGLVVGEYYLDPATPGTIALYSSITWASGDIVQRIGNAVSPSELSFEAAFPPIEMA